MIDTDGKEGTFPVGYTDCRGCHRLILVEHADVDGLCGDCSQEAGKAAEDLMRDTYSAFDGKVNGRGDN